MDYPTTPYTISATDYEDAIYICPTNGRGYSPSANRPAQRMKTTVWVPCFWCDTHGVVRGERGFQDGQPQPHAYPLADSRPVCDLSAAFGDSTWTAGIVRTALRAAGLLGQALEFEAQAQRAVTYRELLIVVRAFVGVHGIGEEEAAL